MSFTVSGPDFGVVFGRIEDEVASAATRAMRITASNLKDDLRAEVQAAGLGKRLAYTWRSEAYPAHAVSLNPAGYTWTKAPAIVDAYSRGVEIVPHAGRKYLAIPTANVPADIRKRGKSLSGRQGGYSMVKAVANRYDGVITVKGRRGTWLVFVNAVEAKNRRGYRPPTKGRAARQRVLVQMFTFVPSVRVRKRFDVEASVQRRLGEYGSLLTGMLESDAPTAWQPDPDVIYLDSGRTVPRSSIKTYSRPAIVGGW